MSEQLHGRWVPFNETGNSFYIVETLKFIFICIKLISSNQCCLSGLKISKEIGAWHKIKVLQHLLCRKRRNIQVKVLRILNVISDSSGQWPSSHSLIHLYWLWKLAWLISSVAPLWFHVWCTFLRNFLLIFSCTFTFLLKLS